MKSLISRFLSAKREKLPAQNIRLFLARYRHLIRQYGQILALCADAADKQTGQYVFDKAYVLALIDRAFECMEMISYDLNALTGQRYLDLYDGVDAVRRSAVELIKVESVSSPESEEEEEFEYRLLTQVRKMLGSPEILTVPGEEADAARSLLPMSRFALREADDSLIELTRSFEFPGTLTVSTPDIPYPIKTSVVNLANLLAGEIEPPAPPQRPAIDTCPAGEFLTAFFSPSIWKDYPSDNDARLSGSFVSYQLEESMSAVIFHGAGFELFDVLLSCAPEANYIYCRFSHVPMLGLADCILAKLGFFVSSAENEIMGWISSLALVDATAKLKAVARLSAFLLQSHSVAVEHTEEDLNRIIGVQA